MIWQVIKSKLRERGARGFAVDAGETAVGYACIAAVATGLGLAALAVGVAALPLAALNVPPAPTSCRNAEEPDDDQRPGEGCRNAEEPSS